MQTNGVFVMRVFVYFVNAVVCSVDELLKAPVVFFYIKPAFEGPIAS